MGIWTHLHVHSQYTLLGSTASIAELVDRAVADGLLHLALTDTNALYGAVAFDRACREAGIRPIIGMTATVALPEDPQGLLKDTTKPGHLVLLAENPSGYRSLCRLSSLLQGHPDREARIARGLSLDDLDAHREGLLCLSGGRRGWTERLLRAGHPQAARRYAGRLATVYGENACLSLELHVPEDVDVAQEVASMGASLGIPTIAVQPVYCLSPQDAPRLKLLAAIDHNCPLDQVPPSALPDEGNPEIDLHWLGPGEMARRFAPFPDALARVGDVVARCDPVLPGGEPVFPLLDLPEGQSPEEALAELARAGLAARYGPQPPAGASERLRAELDAIDRHGYALLFLVVADVVRYARERDVPVSTRGSVANSLVAYCTGITTVDPIANDLLFERFLSPARADAPDIDLDFCSRRRDEVLAYVRRKYGEDKVSLVATVSTLQRRSAVRDLAMRVPLQGKKLTHLVQCGALDGLGESRAALLAEGRDLGRAESALQLSLDLGKPDVDPEPLARRVEWEKQVLGYPVSVLREPLKLVEGRLPECVPLRQLPATNGRAVTAGGVRLPGWTGGKGFYLWDGETWVIVRGDPTSQAPTAWQPLIVRGRWAADEWGFRWFQARDIQVIGPEHRDSG